MTLFADCPTCRVIVKWSARAADGRCWPCHKRHMARVLRRETLDDDPRRDFIGCAICSDHVHCDAEGLCPVCAENMAQEHGSPHDDDTDRQGIIW